MIIGITGKSGCGKSTISKYISSLGYFVIDVDIIHKELSTKYANEIDKIFDTYGFSELSHKEKVKEFFANKELRKIINILLFSKTKDEVTVIINSKKENIIFLDAPLLFGMELDIICNEVWYVCCDAEENVKRLMTRNHLSKEDAWSRYHAINFEDKKIDKIINTTYGIPENEILKNIVRIENLDF